MISPTARWKDRLKTIYYQRKISISKSRAVYKSIWSEIPHLSGEPPSNPALTETVKRIKESRENGNVRTTPDKREMLLENQKRVLLHLQKENEDLRRRLSLAVRDTVKKTDIKSNDEKERERSPPVDSYPVIDNDPRAVIPVTLNLLVEGENHEPMQLFSSGAARGANFRVMEGIHCRLRLDFFVQREGVKDLRYIQEVSQFFRVTRSHYFLGDYTAGYGIHTYTLEPEISPKGILRRGTYTIKSQFVDGDGNKYLTWDWQLKVVKRL